MSTQPSEQKLEKAVEYFAALQARTPLGTTIRADTPEGEEFLNYVVTAYEAALALQKYSPESLTKLIEGGFKISETVRVGSAQGQVRNMYTMLSLKEYPVDSDGIEQALNVLRAGQQILPSELEVKKLRKIQILDDVMGGIGK